ncbi:MAG: 16S rRNA (guanine(527)-N(7))-methyltransferase RsmG [Flavobacteriales bacterium]|nr:16S rRNA (guanine(527)-N(7))-methyltransferase RsmG [Flavobacteriales bacterium]
MELIEKYFPELGENKKAQLKELKDIYTFWNNQINVISRKDIAEFYERHVLHSLSIAKIISFKKKSSILDIGTGGGFPGIPLSILFPETKFTLVDSIGKKIKVVKAVSDELNLKNVSAIKERGENINGQFDFIISRAVTRLDKFIPWTHGKILEENKNSLKNGIIYLKGGNINQEIIDARLNENPTVFPISEIFHEDFFETKLILHIPLK